MFFNDPHSVHQLHAADVHVAHKRRTQGDVVASPRHRWYHRLLDSISIAGVSRASQPVFTAHARIERRRVQPIVGYGFVDASTGQRLDD